LQPAPNRYAVILTNLFSRNEGLLGQVLRYLIAGGVAFIIDFGCLVLLTSGFGIYYLYSAAAAFLLGLTTNYVISVTWVFSKRSLSNRYAEFLIFAWTGMVGLALNQLAMWLLTDFAQLHYTVSKIASTVLVLSWNFVSRKLILFSGRKTCPKGQP